MRLDQLLAKIAERTVWQGTYVDARDLPRYLLLKLIDQGLLVSGVTGWYALTDDGRDAYEAGRSRVKGNSPAWKCEALTGIRETKCKVSGFVVSERSKITSAAIPAGRTPNEETTPDELLEQLELARARRKNMLRALGCTGEELATWLAQGRVKQCRGIDGEPHIGVFDYQRDKFLKYLCRNCINKIRRQRRNQRKERTT